MVLDSKKIYNNISTRIKQDDKIKCDNYKKKKIIEDFQTLNSVDNH